MTIARNPKPAKADRSAEFASYKTQKFNAVMATPKSFTKTVPVTAKLSRAKRTDTRIRDSAKGEECHVRLQGICIIGTESTVWSHWPGLAADRGIGIKALDLCGAYACRACHDAIDRRGILPGHLTYDEVVLDWLIGHMRSLVTLARKGIV